MLLLLRSLYVSFGSTLQSHQTHFPRHFPIFSRAWCFFMVFVNCHVNGAHGGWGFPFMGDHWKNIGKPQSNVDDLGVPPWLGKAPQPPHLHDFRKACGSRSPVLVRMPNWTGTNQWGRNHGITQGVWLTITNLYRWMWKSVLFAIERFISMGESHWGKSVLFAFSLGFAWQLESGTFKSCSNFYGYTNGTYGI